MSGKKHEAHKAPKDSSAEEKPSAEEVVKNEVEKAPDSTPNTPPDTDSLDANPAGEKPEGEDTEGVEAGEVVPEKEIAAPAPPTPTPGPVAPNSTRLAGLGIESKLKAPSIGRIVHYVMEDGQERPAVIVRVWGEDVNSSVQLQVFTDGGNDSLPNVVWKTSVNQSEEAEKGKFHFPKF